MLLRLLLIINFFFWLSASSHAGENDSIIQAKNEFMVRRTFHSFFDGAPVCQTLEERVDYGIFMNSAGLGFRRKIKEGHFVSGTADFYRYYNALPVRNITLGAALHRSFVDFRADYSKQLFRSEYVILLDAGLSYRAGSETLLEEYKKTASGNNMIYVVTHDMKKVGISAGVTWSYNNWEKFHVYYQLKYTGYLSAIKQPDLAYSSETKPTAHMLNFGVIVGFGK